MKSKTYQLPMYDERAENTYNTANRTMTGNLGDWLIDNYGTIGTVSPEQELKYQDISDKAMEAAWSDYNRELGKAQSAANARAYNRFGSLTNTLALYDQETFARQANAGATDLGSATAHYMNSLINQDINRQLQSWQQYSNMYNKAGEDITTLDKYNWNIRNQNKDRAYTNDISKFQAKVATAQALADMVDPAQKMMSQLQGSNSGAGLFNSYNSANNFTDFMNNRYGAGSFTTGSSSITPSSISSLNSWLDTGSTFKDDVLANFGSSAASNGGSWLSSVGNWFKGLGGK